MEQDKFLFKTNKKNKMKQEENIIQNPITLGLQPEPLEPPEFISDVDGDEEGGEEEGGEQSEPINQLQPDMSNDCKEFFSLETAKGLKIVAGSSTRPVEYCQCLVLGVYDRIKNENGETISKPNCVG